MKKEAEIGPFFKTERELNFYIWWPRTKSCALRSQSVANLINVYKSQWLYGCTLWVAVWLSGLRQFTIGKSPGFESQ